MLQMPLQQHSLSLEISSSWFIMPGFATFGSERHLAWAAPARLTIFPSVATMPTIPLSHGWQKGSSVSLDLWVKANACDPQLNSGGALAAWRLAFSPPLSVLKTRHHVQGANTPNFLAHVIHEEDGATVSIENTLLNGLGSVGG